MSEIAVDLTRTPTLYVDSSQGLLVDVISPLVASLTQQGGVLVIHAHGMDTACRCPFMNEGSREKSLRVIRNDADSQRPDDNES